MEFATALRPTLGLIESEYTVRSDSSKWYKLCVRGTGVDTDAATMALRSFSVAK